MEGQTGNSLVIPSLGEMDVANYACNVSNEAGYQYKNVIVNILTVSARITKGLPKELMVSRGSDVILPCSAEGHPAPSIVWRKDGEEVEEDDEKYVLETETGELIVKDASV